MTVMFSLHAKGAEDVAAKVLLKRGWQTGMSHHVSHETTHHVGLMHGAVTNYHYNEFNIAVWAAPDGKQIFGVQPIVFVMETKPASGIPGFDSRKQGKGPSGNAAAESMWNAVANSWAYYDGEGEFAGKGGAGWTNGASTTIGIPSPIGTLIKRPDIAISQKIAAPANLPKAAVAPGHRWTVELEGMVLSVGMVKAVVQCEFQRIEKSNGFDCAILVYQAPLVALPGKGLDNQQTPAPLLENATMKGEIWLEITTGVTVRESCHMIGSTGRLPGKRLDRLDIKDEMRLVSKSPLDPTTPLPPPLRKEPTGLVESSEDAEIGGKGIPLGPRWKIGSRYTFVYRSSIENHMATGASVPPVTLKSEEETHCEELVTAGESPGGSRHERRILALVSRKEPGGKIIYDSRQPENPKDTEYESAKLLWEGDYRDSSQFTERDAGGRVVRRSLLVKDGVPPPGNGAGVRPRNASNIEDEILSGSILAGKSKNPGDAWPFEYRMGGFMIADEMLVKGTIHFRGIEEKEGRRIATLKLEGIVTDADDPKMKKAGAGSVDKGAIMGSILIDLNDGTVWDSRVETDLSMNIAVPGAPVKVRSKQKQIKSWQLQEIDPASEGVSSVKTAAGVLNAAVLPQEFGFILNKRGGGFRITGIGDACRLVFFDDHGEGVEDTWETELTKKADGSWMTDRKIMLRVEALAAPVAFDGKKFGWKVKITGKDPAYLELRRSLPMVDFGDPENTEYFGNPVSTEAALLAVKDQAAHTPPKGSPERDAIMDVMRFDFYKDKNKGNANPEKILFVVHHLKVKDGWACVNVTPTKNGKEFAEPRWAVLRESKDGWEKVDYFEKLRPFAREADTLDALNMSQDTVRRLLPKLPGCPKEIFP